ncbi:MAG: adenylate/guanylate cyclase domain-containing protein [Pseudomonadota bacterium]
MEVFGEEAPGGVGQEVLSSPMISVLLVDDQKLIGKMVNSILSQEKGLRFHHCTDPEQAIQEAVEFQPTVILLDLVMPKIGGLQLLPLFRAHPSFEDVPIIVLSGKEEANTKAAAFALGANDYLVKLPDMVELVARIRHHSRGYTSLLERNEAMRALTEAQKKLERHSRLIRETFGRYLSDDVVDSLLESEAGRRLGGEERTVTIMMTDLRGFTSLSERHAAEHVVALINNYLGVMTDVVLKYHGTIIEFLGDAIFAVFGAPISRGDDAANAVACAIEMQIQMDEVNRLNREQGLPVVEMGIGLNTGSVAVGNIGSERRVKYGVVGRHVNLAARIESYTVGGQILISDSTVEAIGPILLIISRQEVKPKGVKAPIVIHDVTGIGGEYGIYMEERARPRLFRFPTELGIQFHSITGKDAGDVVNEAKIVGLSAVEAEVVSPLKLAKHSNIKLRLLEQGGGVIPGDMYAKVVEETETGFLVHFTSLPPEIEAFLKGLLFWHSTRTEGSETAD